MVHQIKATEEMSTLSKDSSVPLIHISNLSDLGLICLHVLRKQKICFWIEEFIHSRIFPKKHTLRLIGSCFLCRISAAVLLLLFYLFIFSHLFNIYLFIYFIGCKGKMKLKLKNHETQIHSTCF